MTVYIDIVIIENLIINYFLILITTQIIGIKTKEINMLLASLLGSVYTLFIFLPKLNFLTNIIGKCIVVIIMMIISINRKKVAVILKASITFFMISFMFVGICFFFSLIQNNYDITKAFVIEKYSSKYLIFAAIIIYIIFNRVIFYIKDRISISSLIYDLEMNIDGEVIKLKGFLDTGNELVEPLTSLPVLIAEKHYFGNITLEDKELFSIPYKVVNGYNNMISGFRVKNIKIYNKSSNLLIKDAIVCFCDQRLSGDGDYEALLSRGMI